MRRLIVNADDFGYTQGVNRAIVEAHLGGVVTSTTLMATGAAYADATRLASSVPELSIGCHVVLTDGKPVLSAEQLASITHGSHFRDGMLTFAARAIAGGAILTNQQLLGAQAVQRGQTVTLIADAGGISVRMAGRALSDGLINQRIKVENLSSGKIVEGIARSSQVVEIVF